MIIIITSKNDNTKLVDGFNPFAKYSSKQDLPHFEGENSKHIWNHHLQHGPRAGCYKWSEMVALNKWPEINRQLRWFHPDITRVLGPHTATNRGGMAVVASWGWVWGPNPPKTLQTWSPQVWTQRSFFSWDVFFDSQMTQEKYHEMLVGSKRDLDFIEIFHGFINHPYI